MTPTKNPRAKERKPPRITDIRATWIFPSDKLTPVRVLELAIPHRMPSLNEIINMKAVAGDKWAQAQWSEFKEAYEKAVRFEWVKLGIAHGSAPVIKGAYKCAYSLLCADKRTDPSNLFAGAEKVILDALVRCGALPGDGFKFHKGSKYTTTDSNKWGVVVTVKGL